MSEARYFRYTPGVLIVPMILVLLIWTVFWIEISFRVNLNILGIYPRTLSGLKGVLFSPFIHGSIAHLYNNTIPLAILSAALVYFYRASAFRVLIFGIFLSGILTWLIGRPSFHIGASGLIYVLASFIFFKGILSRYYRLVALSLVVVFIYGGLLWYIFPIEDGISWEGHLAGLLSGMVLALAVPSKLPPLKQYTWEKSGYREEEDEFLRHFDEEGNFIESAKEQDHSGNGSVEVRYRYKANNSEHEDP